MICVKPPLSRISARSIAIVPTFTFLSLTLVKCPSNIAEDVFHLVAQNHQHSDDHYRNQH